MSLICHAPEWRCFASVIAFFFTTPPPMEGLMAIYMADGDRDRFKYTGNIFGIF
jgi:hypothetical protein